VSWLHAVHSNEIRPRVWTWEATGGAEEAAQGFGVVVTAWATGCVRLCRSAAARLEPKVHVRSDIMMGVEPDLEKAPYIRDRGKSAWAADAACARCGATLQGFCTTLATSEETQGV
jgi:hypothetical protein